MTVSPNVDYDYWVPTLRTGGGNVHARRPGAADYLAQIRHW